jgi:predicted O-methyltransferase YrrM
MNDRLFLLKEFLQYRWTAKTAHGVHSPFVFEFMNAVLRDRRDFPAFGEIAELRRKLLADTRVLQVEDFGAGSHTVATKERRVNDIARTAGRTPKFGKLLFRLVNHYGHQRILELGTSLGLGTAYLGKANTSATLYTLEGSGAVAEVARGNFQQHGLSHVQQVIGNFDDTLEPVLREMGTVDLLFMDGNHREEPTLRYFRQALPFLHEHSMVVFDDVHWSPGMRAAWNAICADPAVTLSIDLFFFGLVFFRKDFKEKQHFVLRY